MYPRNGIISGNTVTQVGLNPADTGTSSIYIDGVQYVTIENNTVHDVGYNGIFTGNEDTGNLFGTGPVPVITDYIIVRRNKVYNVKSIGMSIGGGFYGTSQNGRYVHNTIAFTTTGNNYGYYLSKGNGHIAKNNIGYFGSSGTFYMFANHWNVTTNPTLDYNDYFRQARRISGTRMGTIVVFTTAFQRTGQRNSRI